MGSTALAISTRISELETLQQAADAAIEQLLVLARDTDAADREAAGLLLRAAEVIGRAGQAREGQLVQILGHADRVKANRGGLVPWIATTLDVTLGAARGMAQSAREIGALPALSEQLSSGRIGSGTIRALTRTARAVKGTGRDLTETLTDTLTAAAADGLGEANRRVRILEETLEPGRAEEQLAQARRRSFLRVTDTESGMTRIEALLDPERATIVRAVLDQSVSAWLRARQYDHTNPVPDDVTSIEQLQAHALTRFAEVFAAAEPAAREAAFTPPVLYHAPLDETEDAGLAQSTYGTLLPRRILPDVKSPAAHLLRHDHGNPIVLDGKPLDHNPTARLATPAQRTALAWRDQHCTHPGCHRPPIWEPLRFYLCPSGMRVVESVWVSRQRLKISCVRCSRRSGRTLMSVSGDFSPGRMRGGWGVAGSGWWPGLSGSRRRPFRGALESSRPERCRPVGYGARARGASHGRRRSPASSVPSWH